MKTKQTLRMEAEQDRHFEERDTQEGTLDTIFLVDGEEDYSAIAAQMRRRNIFS